MIQKGGPKASKSKDDVVSGTLVVAIKLYSTSVLTPRNQAAASASSAVSPQDKGTSRDKHYTALESKSGSTPPSSARPLYPSSSSASASASSLSSPSSSPSSSTRSLSASASSSALGEAENIDMLEKIIAESKERQQKVKADRQDDIKTQERLEEKERAPAKSPSNQQNQESCIIC